MEEDNRGARGKCLSASPLDDDSKRLAVDLRKERSPIDLYEDVRYFLCVRCETKRVLWKIDLSEAKEVISWFMTPKRCFGPFCLDIETGDLTRNNRRLRLQPQPLRLLVLLTEFPGRLLPRQEIQQKIWGEDTFVDFDQSLNFTIRQIRLALQDSAENPKYIETVPKRGYRFIADVQDANGPVGTAARPLAPAADPQAETKMDPIAAEPAPLNVKRVLLRTPWVWVILLTVIGVTIGIPLWNYLWARGSASNEVTIAVLPFEDLTGNPARRYLSHGMTDEIISRLARTSGSRLRVTADSAITPGQAGSQDLQKIARDLDVQYIVRGTIQAEGNHLRVNAHLVRSRDLREIWSETYDGDPSQMLAMEQTVSEAVLLALSFKIAPIGTTAQHEPSFDAHQKYLQGVNFLAQRSRTGFEEALHSFSSAVEADPRYADAYAELATTYNLMGQYGWTSPRDARVLGRAAASQALAVDPLHAGAHAALGFSLWFYDWDIAGGEKELLQSITLAPNSVNGHHWYANLLMTQGRFPEAEEQMRMALRLDPKSAILRTNLGWIHYEAGNYGLALSEIAAVVSEKPDFLTAHHKLWYIYSAQHDQVHAWQEFVQIADAGYPQSKQATLATYREHGYAAALKEFALNPNLSSDSLVDRARFLVCAGENRAALDMLERAYRDHEGWMIFVSKDPLFQSMNADPAFTQLTAEVSSARPNRF